MSGTFGLNDVSQMPFADKLQDLFFVYGDGVIKCAACCVETEVNNWVNHSWYAAHHWGLPMEPEMKRKLLKELHVLQYEAPHEIGDRAYVRDEVDKSWPEDNSHLHSLDWGCGRE